MFTVLVVDDEYLEREAMINLVDWKESNCTLLDTAQDGVEGLSKILSLKPDIVITDISMPKMDGLSMIEKAIKEGSDAIFIILSGYGEYEYTSRAMENGVRHYILKPIDEEKILVALRKAQKDKKEKKQINEIISTFEPSLKSGFFLKALKTEISKNEWNLYKEYFSLEGAMGGLFAFTVQGSTSENAEEEFLSYSSSVLGKNALFNAVLKGIYYFLISSNSDYYLLENSARSIRGYALSQGFRDIRFSFSSNKNLLKAKNETESLLASKWKSGPIVKSNTPINKTEIEKIIRRDEWKGIKDYISLYRYASLFDLLMESKSYSDLLRENMISSFSLMTGVRYSKGTTREDVFSFIENVWKKTIDESDEERRWRTIIRFFFFNLPSSSFSLKNISQECAYMNEDYFSRYFQKKAGVKFSKLLTDERMKSALSILSFNPTIQIGDLAILCGYRENGQYLQKVFKETFNETISSVRSRFFSLS